METIDREFGQAVRSACDDRCRQPVPDQPGSVLDGVGEEEQAVLIVVARPLIP